MIRVSLRDASGEPIDHFEAVDEKQAAETIAAKLQHRSWTLNDGDSITIEKVT